jgi:TRAP-type C4-dicarboxylate transport system permease small subunit
VLFRSGTNRLIVEILVRLVVLAVALCLVYFGYINFLRGFSSFRMPSMTPIASLYGAIPISGALMVLFTIEQLVNGWRNGFDHPDDREPVITDAPPLVREGERS